MMYKNKLAVALKSAGKVLREFKDEVYVPFGSEYSIFIKNLNSVRALVTVSVDGEDVGEGTKFVIDANDSIDLEGSLRTATTKLEIVSSSSNEQMQLRITVALVLKMVWFELSFNSRNLLPLITTISHHTIHRMIIGMATHVVVSRLLAELVTLEEDR